MRSRILLVSVGAIFLWGSFGPQAGADPCLSFSFTPVFCEDFDSYCDPPPGSGSVCAPGATPDNGAFHGSWPADGSCAPDSMMNPLLAGTDVLGTFGSLNVQLGGNWEPITYDRIYRHVHDLTPQIVAHPNNANGGELVNGAGPIDQPLVGNSVPPTYVDSMSSTLRPEALKGTFYLHPLDGVNKAAMANMVYYHEMFLGDDRAPTDFVRKDCNFEHDCNCFHSNPTATCETHACQYYPCEGTCDFHPCVNNQCAGGPKAGQTCSRDIQCSQCAGGPNPGAACTGNYECSGCAGGPNDGLRCSDSQDCEGVCADGPRAGQSCTSDGNCGVCIGGAAPGAACGSDHGCQYQCGPEQTPTCEGGPRDGTVCTEDSECAGGPYFPILEPTDGQVHASFAVGLMAILDGTSPAVTGTSGIDPCDLDQGRFPSEWRMVVFDGLQWHTFKAPAYDIPLTSPADVADFYPLYGWNKVDFAIGADYIEVRLTNIRSQALHSGIGKCIFGACNGGASHGSACTTDANCLAGTSRIPNEYVVARVPRQYKGPFNRYAIGPGHGRNVTDPQNPGPEECIDALSSSDIISDEIVLYDGVFVSLKGACCATDGGCTEVTESECLARNGRFQGLDTTCDDTLCCPLPFADVDHDSDVDQSDFGAFQLCYTGASGGVPAGCECLNRDKDTDVDNDDFTAFADCWSGANTPWSTTIAPSCVP